MSFKAIVTDESGITEVHAIYRFGWGSTVTNRVKMAPTGPGSGLFSSEEVEVPPHFVGSMVYEINALDGDGSDASTAERSIRVRDDDRPYIKFDASDAVALTGEIFHLGVILGDNIGVTSVWASYLFGDLEVDEIGFIALIGVSISGRGNGTYMYNLYVPQSTAGDLLYSIGVEDAEGNRLETDYRRAPLKDIITPTFGPDQTDESAEKGRIFAFRIRATDNIGISGVWVVYWFGSGERYEVELEGGPMYHLYMDIPLWARGNLHYMLSTHDDDGNQVWMDMVEVPVLNPPPQVLSIPPWYVVEDQESVLDLTSYLSDPNDPLTNLQVDCFHPNIKEGDLQLRAFYSDWVPGHWIELEVSDGDHSTNGVIWVEVVDVNSPPHVRIISFLDGAEFFEWELIPLIADYGDPDMAEGKEVTITWETAALGILFKYNNTNAPNDPTASLPDGAHVINVTVSDGEHTAMDQTRIVVIRVDEDTIGGDDQDGSPSMLLEDQNIILALMAMVIILAIFGYIVQNRF